MSNALTRSEKKIAAALASVFGLRMLGLFMVMPVIALYGEELEGFDKIWIGIIIGAYGFTQAILQIPMGLLSDRWGRRKVIILGLVLFAIGSLIAATADDVVWVTIGRFLQGTGAIASAVLALAADLTREEQRSKVMAVIGMCIGLSFALAMVLGPMVAARYGLDGIFWLTAGLALVGIVVVLLAIPDTVTRGAQRDAIPVPAQITRLISDKQLFKLNFGVFFLHLQLTTLFVVLPGLLISAGYPSQSHGLLYFPALLASFLLMAPMLIWAMRNNREASMFKFAIWLLAGAAVLTAFADNTGLLLIIALVVFFAAFNFLEANLPAWISRLAPVGQKGSAMGIFSSSQFAGAFVGGLFGGALLQVFDAQTTLLIVSSLALPWWWLTRGLVLPIRTKPRVVKLKILDHHDAETMASQLTEIEGIEEAVVFVEEQQAYLKVQPKLLDDKALANWLAEHS